MNHPEHIVGAKEVTQMQEDGWRCTGNITKVGSGWMSIWTRSHGDREEFLSVVLSNDMSRWPDTEENAQQMEMQLT